MKKEEDAQKEGCSFAENFHVQRLANGTAQTKTQTKIKIGGVNHRYEFTP